MQWRHLAVSGPSITPQFPQSSSNSKHCRSSGPPQALMDFTQAQWEGTSCRLQFAVWRLLWFYIQRSSWEPVHNLEATLDQWEAGDRGDCFPLLWGSCIPLLCHPWTTPKPSCLQLCSAHLLQVCSWRNHLYTHLQPRSTLWHLSLRKMVFGGHYHKLLKHNLINLWYCTNMNYHRLCKKILTFLGFSWLIACNIMNHAMMIDIAWKIFFSPRDQN